MKILHLFFLYFIINNSTETNIFRNILLGLGHFGRSSGKYSIAAAERNSMRSFGKFSIKHSIAKGSKNIAANMAGGIVGGAAAEAAANILSSKRTMI